jgi:Ni,Fe-hydrogenase III large subunit
MTTTTERPVDIHNFWIHAVDEDLQAVEYLASCSGVRASEGDRPIVSRNIGERAVVVVVGEDDDRTLVCIDDVLQPVELLTKAIRDLTRARDQLVALQAVAQTAAVVSS